MATDFKISNVGRSLMRAVVDVIDDCIASGVSPNLTYYAWDSRGDEAELPTEDLIGLSGWTFKENNGLWDVFMGITLSTYADENLFREMQIIDMIHDRLGERQTVPLFDDDGNEYTQLGVFDFEMMPAGHSEKRNFRPIAMELKRTANV